MLKGVLDADWAAPLFAVANVGSHERVSFEIEYVYAAWKLSPLLKRLFRMNSSPLYRERSLVSSTLRPPVNCGYGCRKNGLLNAVERPIVWTPPVVCCETATATVATLPPVGPPAIAVVTDGNALNVAVPAELFVPV